MDGLAHERLKMEQLITTAVDELLIERNLSEKSGNTRRASEIKENLEKLNIKITDTRNGTFWAVS